MAKIKTKYVCQSCGYETSKWLGKCPECTKWNTFVEEIEEKESNKEVFIIDKASSRPVNINSIETKEEERFSTQYRRTRQSIRWRYSKRIFSISRRRSWNRKIYTFNSSI